MLDLFSILTLCVSIIAVIITYIGMRRRLKQEQESSKSMAKLINTLREELKLFRKSSKTDEDIKRQKLLLRKGQHQWNQLKDLGKLAKFLLEHTDDSEEEDEDEY